MAILKNEDCAKKVAISSFMSIARVANCCDLCNR